MLRVQDTLTMGVACLLVASATTLCAAPSVPEVTHLAVGFAGLYKVGYWTPVELRLRSSGAAWQGQVELVTTDGDGVPSRVVGDSTKPLIVAPRGESRVNLCVKFGRQSNRLEIVFRDTDGKELSRQSIRSGATNDPVGYADALASNDELVLTVGPAPGLDGLAHLVRGGEHGALRIARLDDTSTLPTRWYGYDGIDMLVFATAREDAYGGLSTDGAQRAALFEWIERGGRMVLSVGAQAPTVLGRDMPLAPLAPGGFDRLVELKIFGALEEFAEAETALTAGAGLPGAGQTAVGESGAVLAVPRLDGYEGTIVVHEADLPLVVRTARGFGQVLFTAFDFDAAPLRTWSGLPGLWAHLLDKPVGEALVAGPARAGQVNWLGIDDLSAQLRGSLDQFTGVQLVPFWLVALMVVVYLLLIGPLDYWLVKHVLRRMELTWITFPLTVALASVGAMILAAWTKGDALRLNQVELLDIDLASGQARGTAWANLFSPRPTSYDVQLAVPALAGQVPGSMLLSWMGLPGDALGGLHAASLESSLWSDAYDASPDRGALTGVPVQIWSSKSFVARWKEPARYRLDSSLRAGPDQVPSGELVNRTGWVLDDCLLAFGRWGISFKHPWQPGETLDVADELAGLERTELVTRLTDRVMVFDSQRNEFVRQSRAYDEATFDRGRILRQMMFFQAAGGRGYAQLTNRYQGFVDLSGHLQAGRALLVAHLPADAGTAWQLNGQAAVGEHVARESFVRFVIPVLPATDAVAVPPLKADQRD